MKMNERLKIYYRCKKVDIYGRTVRTKTKIGRKKLLILMVGQWRERRVGLFYAIEQDIEQRNVQRVSAGPQG